MSALPPSVKSPEQNDLPVVGLGQLPLLDFRGVRQSAPFVQLPDSVLSGIVSLGRRARTLTFSWKPETAAPATVSGPLGQMVDPRLDPYIEAGSRVRVASEQLLVIKLQSLQTQLSFLLED